MGELGTDASHSDGKTRRLRVRRRLVLLLYYLVGVVGYLLLGGLVFSLVEGAHERSHNQLVEDTLRSLNITKDSLIYQKLDELNICSFQVHHWDYLGSVFYALTVVTTIGYGSYAARTSVGRGFTALYALLGISLIASSLNRVTTVLLEIAQGAVEFCGTAAPQGKQLEADVELTFERFDVDNSGLMEVKELESFLTCLSGGRKVDPRVVEHVIAVSDKEGMGGIPRDELTAAMAEFFKLQQEIPTAPTTWHVVGSTVTLSIWLVVWSVILSTLENWSIPESLWFSFVTLSTIGFGDFVPSSDRGRVAAFIFIFFGLGMLAWLLSALNQAFNAKRYWLMQSAYRRGLCPEKVLDAQGMVPLSPVQPSPTRRTPDCSRLVSDRKYVRYKEPYASVNTIPSTGTSSALLMSGTLPSLPKRKLPSPPLQATDREPFPEAPLPNSTPPPPAVVPVKKVHLDSTLAPSSPTPAPPHPPPRCDFPSPSPPPYKQALAVLSSVRVPGPPPPTLFDYSKPLPDPHCQLWDASSSASSSYSPLP